MGWFVASIFTLALWTVWGVFAKVAGRYAGTATILLSQAVGNFVIYAAVAYYTRLRFEGKPMGIALGIGAGIAGTLGTLVFLYALTKGRASIVVPLSAMYPVVVAVVSILLLKEPFTWKVGLGVFFATLAVLLLAL